MTERDAIARMQRGDISGLEALVQQHQLQAVRTAMLITRDAALAEDVVQAAFIRAYEKIHQFDPERAFAPWFMRSVVNAAVQAARKGQRLLSLDDQAGEDVTFAELLEDHSAGPLEQLQDAEQKAVIRAALDQLSPEQRAAVVMRYYLDMSEQEMANALEAPAGTVKWRLHAARKRLKGLLQRTRPSSTQWEARNG